MSLEPIATIEFAGGMMRPVYEEHGRQFVIDGDGSRIYGIWFIPRDQADEPVIVTAGCSNNEFPF